MSRLIAASTLGAVLSLVLAPAALAASPSCTAQFTSTLAPIVRPFGSAIVVPEVQDLTLGGPNLGLEVKTLLATADKGDCPVTP